MPDGPVARQLQIILNHPAVVGVHPRVDPAAVHFEGFPHDRQAIHPKDDRHTGGAGHLEAVARQAEAGDIRGAVDGIPLHDFAGRTVEGDEMGDAFGQSLGRNPAFDIGVEEHPAADGLGQHQTVAGTRPGIGPDPVRVDDAVDRQAEFGFVVLDGVPPDQHGPGLGDLVHRTGDNPVQNFRG